MKTNGRNFFNLPLALRSYRRSGTLVLVNGLAEQSESWFANRPYWSRLFDVKVPELLVYDGDELHRHIESGGEVTIGYLTDRLSRFLDEFVQKPPYHLVGSSLGGQILLTYASRYPEKVAKLVLICPSGLHGEENLPVMDGVRRSDYDSLVRSVFHRTPFAGEDLVEAIERKFQDRRWKKGVLRTLRGTVGHSVGDLLERVEHPTLLIWGQDDRIIADIPGSIRAASRMPRARQVVIPRCGHAPQIERAGLVNKLVVKFLKDSLDTIPPALDPNRSLSKVRA
ncbi:alpha/beta fold hydrolase [Tautonia sociabilis]|uniref:Alpha/beta fold hydrolase n=1 Tax=Tautonia sociabilis TaxID=2080755 RepID=A0A432MLA4_9BACT|nr:alpha/beta fold hydrolase [Tautonia sociabilis]RUL88203.1 alpha/beta fold hydrolase [Tautonia sociabilis]